MAKCFAVRTSCIGSTSRNKKKKNLLCVCPLILRLELSHNAIENKFTRTWLTHYIIFQIRNGNELTGQSYRCSQYLNCKILQGGTLLQPWPNAFGMRKYFSEDYVIPSPKLNQHQKKVFAGNWSVFSPKLDKELGLFRLIIQRSNLDGGHLNLDGETLNLDGGTLTINGGSVLPCPPYNLSTGCSQAGTVGPPLLNWNATNDEKVWQQSLFFIQL